MAAGEHLAHNTTATTPRDTSFIPNKKVNLKIGALNKFGHLKITNKKSSIVKRFKRLFHIEELYYI